MKFTNEDIEKIEKFIELKNKGFYCDGTQLTEVYNRVLEKHVNPTNCGSCLRGRIQELESALNSFKQKMALESKKEQEVDNIPQERDETSSSIESNDSKENKAVKEAGNSLKSKAKKK